MRVVALGTVLALWASSPDPALAAEACDPPEMVSLTAPEDYPPLEPMVRACLAGLLDEPLGSDAEGHALRQTFVMRWLTGVPYLNVRVRLDGAAKSALKANKGRDSGLEAWYVFGLARAALQEGAEAVAVEEAGLRAMLARYRAMRQSGGKKNKVLDRWGALDEAGWRALASDSVAETEVP